MLPRIMQDMAFPLLRASFRWSEALFAYTLEDFIT